MANNKIENIVDRKWYKNLKQSKLSPPSYVFGIVWTFLYILLALYFIFAISIKGTKYAIIYFVLQMIVNLSWTYVFFKRRNFSLALGMTIFMILATAMSMWEMFKINKLLPLLLVPYILWLCLAGYLNWFIIVKN
jgi:translocator protein